MPYPNLSFADMTAAVVRQVLISLSESLKLTDYLFVFCLFCQNYFCIIVFAGN